MRVLGAMVLLLSACATEAPDSLCGPSSGVVMRVSDGDTFVLESGEKIRMLMIDTPEVGTDAECFGNEASAYTRQILFQKNVTLQYDATCTDRFGRLLAYVFLDGQEINRRLVEEGYACVLHISPNGDDRVDEFNALEGAARSNANGLWGVCSKSPC